MLTTHLRSTVPECHHFLRVHLLGLKRPSQTCGHIRYYFNDLQETQEKKASALALLLLRTEICELNPSMPIDEDILWLEIAMQNEASMAEGQGREDLAHTASCKSLAFMSMRQKRCVDFNTVFDLEHAGTDERCRHPTVELGIKALLKVIVHLP